MGDRGRKAWLYFENQGEITPGRLEDLEEPEMDNNHSCPQDENLIQLLNLLGLKNLYPRKISIISVTEINFDYLKEPRDWKEVPWWTLKKIISSDFRYRENILYDTMQPTQPLNIFDDEEFEDTNAATNGDKVFNPHPADVFCAIFLCCDDFLKEVLCRKMVKLQVALPLTFTISSKILLFKWPLNRIFLDEESESVVNAKYKSILFLRLGNISFPKSKIINEILWKQKYETFLHKRPKSGLEYRTVSKGCIEVSWYIKDEESDAKFSENLTFLNLRGDGLICESERKLILPSCSIVVLFIEYRNILDLDTSILSELRNTGARLIVITKFSEDLDHQEIKRTLRNMAETTEKGKEMFDFVSVYDLVSRSKFENAETALQVSRKLKIFLAREKKGKALQGISNTGDGLCIDEDRLKREADVKILEFMSLPFSSFSKSKIMPLQGTDLWQKYSQTLKEKKRLHKESSEDYNDENSKIMTKLREKQIRLCNEDCNVMSKFVEILIRNENENENLLFFIAWLKYELDTISRQNNIRSEDVPDVEKKSIGTALGIEHFFREVGQCFEAFKHFKDQGISSKTLIILNSMPKVVANLLMLGVPLEIMDGDAGNIPMYWINAVFKELQNKLQNKKLLSLSVIGIQSSGKSTMLNTMFGVEFAVSCGRCTRGIYMQLLPVHKSGTFSPNYDYLMLFDTEGLRSVDEENIILHDNELATMVIGVADVVIINIKGETVAEMENVLQIVVYALLRVKQVYRNLNIKPSCVFLHQNAEKGEALKHQMSKITKNLDNVTKTIAERERIPDVKAFKDVIDFDPEENVKYISNLWLGRPPMAPVSESYSRDIMNVGAHILRNMTTKISHCLSVEDSMEKIHNTWEAILSEDFVFSFRNTLEVKAYNSLEFQVKAILFEIENLKNGLGLEIDPALGRCNLSNIDKVSSELELKFETTLNEKKNNGLKKIQEFVEKSEMKAHVIHWKHSKEVSITEKTVSMKRELHEALMARLERWKLKLKNNDEDIWRQMFDEALNLAKDLQNTRLTENDKLKKFDELWTTQVNKRVPKTDDAAIAKKHEKLWKNMTLKLNKEFHEHTKMINTALDVAICKQFSHETFTEYYKQFKIKAEDYEVKENCHGRWFDYKLKNKELENYASNLLAEFCREIDIEMKKNTKDCEYDDTFFTPLLALARKKFKNVDQAQKKNAKVILFTPVCETKFASALCFYVYKRFCKFNENYEKESCLRTWIESKKDRARKVFIDTIQKKEDLDIAVNQLSRDIKDLISKRIKDSIPLKMKEDAERTVSCKYQILADYLVELAEKENFNDYILMLDNPYYASKKNFLEQSIETFIGSGHNSPFNRYVEYEVSRDIVQLEKILEEMNHENSDIKKWIKTLADKMQGLEFKHDYELEFKRYAISDFKEFKKSLMEALQKARAELNKTLSKLEDCEMKLGKANILNTFEEIWGCPELCPFCYEPCQFDKNHTINNQPHRCIQHRPNGLSGWRFMGSEKMLFTHCNWNVQSSLTPRCGVWCGCTVKNCKETHPYQKYKDFIPNWDIPPLSDLSGSPYWSWMFVKFLKDLTDYYKIKMPDIPEDWTYVSKQEAIESIRKFVPK